MYGDLSTWLSLPDEGTLPTRKFIGDDDKIVFNKAKPGSRLKGNEVKPLLVALVTDSMNVVSSSDTLNYREKKLDVESDLDESYDFSHQLSAFSYYSESTDVTTSRSLNTADKKQKSDEKKNLSSRKCVSCPEAAQLSISDYSICSSSSKKKVNRLYRSLEVTLTDHYRDDGHLDDNGIGTTTLDTATDFDKSYRQGTSTTSSSTSSMAFFTEEDAALYPDDDCSRISYVSVYRGSPVLFENTETEETAASLNVVPNDSVRLTYSDFETPTDETAVSLTILSQDSVRLTYVTPTLSPYRNKLRRMPQGGCKTCILDGLKNHPACPSSDFHKSIKDNRSTNTWTNDSEINIIYN